MTRTIISAGADELVSNTLQRMAELRFRHLPVVAENNRLVGLVTHRDLMHALPSSLQQTPEKAQAFIAQVPIRDVMRTDLVTVTPLEALASAGTLMLEKKVGCLPVVDSEDQLVGILTEADFVRCTTSLLARS